jgi:hypothetical protein
MFPLSRGQFFAIAAVALLSACAALHKTEQAVATVNAAATPTRIAEACQTIKSGEDAVLLAASTGTLQAWQLKAVRAAIPFKAPICNTKPMPTSISQAAWDALLGAETATKQIAGSKAP